MSKQQRTLGSFFKDPKAKDKASIKPSSDKPKFAPKPADDKNAKPEAKAPAPKATGAQKNDKMDVDDDNDANTEDSGMVEDKEDTSEVRASKKRRIIESDDESVAEAPVAKKKATAEKAAKKPAVKETNGKSEAPAKVPPIFNKPKSGKEAKTDAKAAASKAEDEHEISSDNEEGSDWGDEDGEAIPAKEEKTAAKQIASIFLRKDEKAAPKTGWKAGDPVPYAALTETFAKIEGTTKRLEILQYLTAFFRQVVARSPDNLLRVVYLCINRLCPDYEGLELGIGESLLIKAIAQGMGRDVAKIKKDFDKLGDLGTVAASSRQKQSTMFRPKRLTVPAVFKDLKTIAQMTGNQSQQRKIDTIVRLLAACEGEETKYLIRSLEGKLRIGLAEKSVVVALAQAIVYTRQENKKLGEAALAQKLEEGTNIVKAVYSELPSYDLVVPALLEGGVEELRDRCKLTPGVPLKPMLAKPTKAIGEVLDRFEGKAFTCEYKYDGERAQVHFLPDGKLAIFSRNSENMSVKYPDLVGTVPKIKKPGKEVTSFCLDCEAVAWKMPELDAEGKMTSEGHLLPFQDLARRKRKDVKVEDIKVKVKLFAFDLLYLNGEPLLQEDLRSRRKMLQEYFQPVENEFDFAKSEDCTTVDEIQVFLDASVKDSCEGLMVKMLDGPPSTYAPSQRSQNWLKLKKDYLAGTGDSLDLVVIGAFLGKGKRTNVYGAFLLACWDADSESYQSICKIGTGFSEEDLSKFYELLKPLETSKKGYYDMGEAKPDVFFEPQVVFEVLTADLSLSPVYTAGKGTVDHRGISLRFPRFIRLRDDKGPEDSTSPEQVVEMYQRQQAVAAGRKGGGGGDEDDGFW